MFCLLLTACVCSNGKLNEYKKYHDMWSPVKVIKGYSIHTKPVAVLVQSHQKETASVWQGASRCVQADEERDTKSEENTATLPVLTFIAVSHSYAKQEEPTQYQKCFHSHTSLSLCSSHP